MTIIGLCFLICLLVSPVVGVSLARVCYLRPDRYFPLQSTLQLDLCTHIIVGFTTIDSNLQLQHDQTFGDFLDFCKKSIDNNSSGAKLMVSIGGGRFGQATSSAENRRKLIDSIMHWISRYKLDGFDIDWEFPDWPDHIFRRYERDNFVKLLKELREVFEKYRLSTGRRLILSVAVAAQWSIINWSYRASSMEEYVDFINLMSYDFHIFKWYYAVVGHNSALHARAHEIGLLRTFNTEWAANYWHSIGIPKNKIMVGIPTYGKRFTLLSKHLTYPGAAAVSGNPDCSYSDVCDFLNLNETTQKFDEEAKVPYAYHEYDWISFENERSSRHKANWIKQNRFGGAMIFSLNADDFRSRCGSSGGVMFPIHSTVQSVFAGEDSL